MQKESILEHDNILVYVENQPAFFARIEEITPDIKKGWWRVKFLALRVPLLVTTWILDNEQIRGAEFTMNGMPIRIEKVIAPETPSVKNSIPQDEPAPAKAAPHKKARIVSLAPKTDQAKK